MDIVHCKIRDNKKTRLVEMFLVQIKTDVLKEKILCFAAPKT